MKQKRAQSAGIEDVLLKQKKDRRVLTYVPDPTGLRAKADRRGEAVADGGTAAARERLVEMGTRYEARYRVRVTARLSGGGRLQFYCESQDVSTTGILLRVENEKNAALLQQAKSVRLKFEITPGSMPEGYEMRVNIRAKLVRVQPADAGVTLCAFMFKETLASYANRAKNSNLMVLSVMCLFVVVLIIILMRAESVIYFRFNKFLYSYSIITALFLLSRYLYGAMYHAVPIDDDFTPGVTILIPCFNEEEWIQRTVMSCINQDYPIDRLEVVVVDDCSTDRSVERVEELIAQLAQEGKRFRVGERLHLLRQPENKGKRDALAAGTLIAKHELIVFVDSDSFLDPFAIRNLVQPFRDPKMGGVSGRTDVANTYTNTLTKMQSVRYYIAFRIMKAAEAYFDSVTCLSGPLACYKKSIIMDNMDDWLNQHFLGQKATFGDDRAMTNFVLRHHRTAYQDTAICSTIVPNDYKSFLKQQMRWKRSWLRESMIAATFMWRKEPFMGTFFFIGLLVPIAAPLVVLYNLVYVPIAYGIFPTTFILGLFTMALMMSFAQLLLKRSSIWIFGMIFCIYYEAVLLWQMPIAWFTFWKSTWGTRMTPADVEAKERKEALKQARRAARRKVSGTGG